MPTLRPTGGTTACTVETGKFSNTYDGYTTTSCCFKRAGTCLSEWYWTNPVNVTKFNILSLYYNLDSEIYLIWGRVNGSWVELWRGTWLPSHNAWDSKAISCKNCDGILIGQRHVSQPSRPCIVDVTVDYEEVVAEGNATIVSIDKPSSFTPNVSFHIKPKVRNDGGSDTLFMGLTNVDTGKVLKHPATYTLYTPAGNRWEQDWIVTLDQITDFHGHVEAGHVKNGSRVVDDTEDITIPVERICTEGTREVLEYCWDGSVKRERVCENNRWVEYTHTCPFEPECTEGTEDILEYCPDGYTVKRKRVCRNGKWVYSDYECVECTPEGAEETLEWCPDGYTVKRKKICKNGKWVEEDYECAACYPEGFEEILEYCEYSYDVKRKRICENGKWVYYDFTCPTCYEGESEVIEYCEDGATVKREKVCVNGKWVEKTYTCPGEPGRIIEMIRAFLSRFLGG